jgi:hypothetical protein
MQFSALNYRRSSLNGHEVETADTAKEHLKPIGTPLLGEMEIFRQQSSLSTRTEANVSDIEHRRHRFMCSNLT